MAQQKGLIKIEGTLDNLTFYKSANGYQVRTKGGVSKERIMNDPAFARTRENGSEFGGSASAGKLLRNSLGTMLFNAKDAKLSSRLLKVMSAVKNLDATSARGARNVADGLLTAEGKMLLQGFDFNGRAPLTSVLYCPYVLNATTGGISIPNLNAQMQLRFPDGATHFSMQSAAVNVDFATGSGEIRYSTTEVYEVTATALSPNLVPSAVPAGVGVPMNLLLIQFFQRVNGVNYALNNGSFNVLNLIQIG